MTTCNISASPPAASHVARQRPGTCPAHRPRPLRAGRLIGVASVLAASLAVLPALAETYTFTGANYTAAYLGNPGPTGTFTNAMRVTGSFTTAAPLPANMPLTPIGPGASPVLVTSWSFSDGLHTFTPANSAPLYGLATYFQVATDAAGQISDYTISFIQPPPPHALNQIVSTVTIDSTRALAVSDARCQSVSATTPVVCNSVLMAGTLESAYVPAGGTWVRAADPAAVPTLSFAGLAAMGAVLGGVAAWSRRRRRG